MELGLIGLGRMGANMARRLTAGGHRVVTYDVNAESVATAVHNGAEGAESVDELVAQLSPPAGRLADAAYRADPPRTPSQQ